LIGGHDTRPWQVAAGLVAALATSVLVNLRPPDGVWGLSGMLAFSPVVRIALVVLAALLALPPVSRWLVRRLRGPAARWREATRGVPAGVWIAGLVALAWLLRSRRMYGDGAQTVELLERGQWINHKEPLDRLFTALVYRAGHTVTGWDAGTAVALVSTLAGVAFWLAVLRLARRRPLPGAGEWPIWLLLGATGATALFFGHVENYAWLTAGTLWTLVLALEAVTEPVRPLWPAALAFGLTFATHLSAIWLAPALVVAWAARAAQRRARWRPTLLEALSGTAVAVAPFAVVAAGMLIGGAGWGGFSAANFGGGDASLFVPLRATASPLERVTLLSAAHLEDFGNQLLLIAPVGALLALVGWLGRRRDGRRTDAGTWVLLAASIGTLIYAFLFNPDMAVFHLGLGALAEWDLFAFAAVPVTLFGLWWLRTAMDEGEERDALVSAAGATALLLAGAWVLFNAGVRL
jgi:hypothetical protein